MSDKERAFDIMKEKDVDVIFIRRYRNAMEYNSHVYTMKLTEEEFNFLKKML